MGNQEALPDAILKMILLCLDSLLWLHRAASTCKRWRRIIAGDAFRTLLSRPSIRPSIVAGSYYNNNHAHGVFVRASFKPSPSAAAVDARKFSLDFLPSDDTTTHWTIQDSRGSLLLLSREDSNTGPWDLIVCEPLTRRHVVIPPPPNPPVFYWNAMAVLLNGDGDGGTIGMSSFRVLLCSYEYARIRACMFTSGSSNSSSAFLRETSIGNIPLSLCDMGFAAERCYWQYHGGKMVVTLDESTLKFSSFVLPIENEEDFRKMILTVGRDGDARIVVEGRGNILKIFARPKGGAGGEEWELEKTIQVTAVMLGLPQLRFFHLTSDQPYDDEGIVRIFGYDGGRALDGTLMRFHLDMETMESERLPGCDLGYMRKEFPSEFPWPPTLRACTDDNA